LACRIGHLVPVWQPCVGSWPVPITIEKRGWLSSLPRCCRWQGAPVQEGPAVRVGGVQQRQSPTPPALGPGADRPDAAEAHHHLAHGVQRVNDVTTPLVLDCRLCPFATAASSCVLLCIDACPDGGVQLPSCPQLFKNNSFFDGKSLLLLERKFAFLIIQFLGKTFLVSYILSRILPFLFQNSCLTAPTGGGEACLSRATPGHGWALAPFAWAPACAGRRSVGHLHAGAAA
jgi:hypothetical protein